MRPMKSLYVVILALLLLMTELGFAAVWPIGNSRNPDQITSDYGPRITKNGVGFHYGIDLRARTPKPVHAIQGGSIEWIVIGSSSGGNMVRLGGVEYLHLSEDSGGYEFRLNTQLGAYIVVKNNSGVVTKVLFKDANTELEPGLPRSINTVSEGEVLAYSGSSGTRDPHLHIQLSQYGPNPLGILPYSFAPSRIEVFGIEPPNNQVSGRVKIIAGIKSCEPQGGACSGTSIPDLNEVKMEVEDECAEQSV